MNSISRPRPAVREESLRSLRLTTYFEGHALSTATCFLYHHAGRHYIVTNWHVVTGRNPITGEYLDQTSYPEQFAVLFNLKGRLGHWIELEADLYDDGHLPKWREHRRWGRKVDVVVMELTPSDLIDLYSYAQAPSDLIVGPADRLSIIGFPFGGTGGGGMGVWVQGAVATEPEIDWEGLPCFLIDSRTRSGQSGSPVIYYGTGPFTTTSGVTMSGTPVSHLLGIYSGRIREDSDLGFVWRASVLDEIIEDGVQGTA